MYIHVCLVHFPAKGKLNTKSAIFEILEKWFKKNIKITPASQEENSKMIPLHLSRFLSNVTSDQRYLSRVCEFISTLTSLFILFLLTYLFFCTHLWHADTLWAGTEYTALLYNSRLLHKILCHLRHSVRRSFLIALPINSLRYYVGMCICISWLINWAHSFQCLFFFMNLFGCHLWYWEVVRPGFDFPKQFIVQPQKWKSETLKSGSQGGNPWEYSWWYQSTLLNSSHLVSVWPPYPDAGSKREAKPEGKKKISLGLLSKQITGISTAAHHNASKVPHSFISPYLSLHIPKHMTVRGLKMASSPFNTDPVWVSGHTSWGTQGTLKSSETLMHSEKKKTGIQPGGLSTSNSEGTHISSAWH